MEGGARGEEFFWGKKERQVEENGEELLFGKRKRGDNLFPE